MDQVQPSWKPSISDRLPLTVSISFPVYAFSFSCSRCLEGSVLVLGSAQLLVSPSVCCLSCFALKVKGWYSYLCLPPFLIADVLKRNLLGLVHRIFYFTWAYLSWRKKETLESRCIFCFSLLISFCIDPRPLESGCWWFHYCQNASFSTGHFFLSGRFLGKTCSLDCFMVMILGEEDLPLSKCFLFGSI